MPPKSTDAGADAPAIEPVADEVLITDHGGPSDGATDAGADAPVVPVDDRGVALELSEAPNGDNVPPFVTPMRFEAAAEAESGDAAEPEMEAALEELNASLIPMCHPEGGTCDAYESDEDGNILVPATDAASMMEHGFIVADA